MPGKALHVGPAYARIDRYIVVQKQHKVAAAFFECPIARSRQSGRNFLDENQWEDFGERRNDRFGAVGAGAHRDDHFEIHMRRPCYAAKRLQRSLNGYISVVSGYYN